VDDTIDDYQSDTSSDSPAKTAQRQKETKKFIDAAIRKEAQGIRLSNKEFAVLSVYRKQMQKDEQDEARSDGEPDDGSAEGSQTSYQREDLTSENEGGEVASVQNRRSDSPPTGEDDESYDQSGHLDSFDARSFDNAADEFAADRDHSDASVESYLAEDGWNESAPNDSPRIQRRQRDRSNSRRRRRAVSR